ncbi:MAG: ROK family protein [Thermoanaerobaculia bacterium]|nr:ROK family protein [Thermoanaerobaculia bacterium]
MGYGEGVAVGVDAGGTNIKGVAITPDGRELARRSTATPADRERLVAAVATTVSALEAEAGAASHVGLAAPGLAARDGRSIAWMQGRMEAVQGLDWTAALARSSLVRVINDAHAALVAEAWLGAATGAADVVLLTLGTGVGGAVMVGGRLLEGHLGRAGHLGHLSLDVDGPPDICRTPGSLEDAVGDCTVARRSGGRFDDTAALVAAAIAGDAEARAVWGRTVASLAAGIASIVNAVDPEVVVLGGGIAKAGEALFEPLRREMEKVEWRPLGGDGVPIVAAGLGDVAGAIGAARWAATASERGDDAI